MNFRTPEHRAAWIKNEIRSMRNELFTSAPVSALTLGYEESQSKSTGTMDLSALQ